MNAAMCDSRTMPGTTGLPEVRVKRSRSYLSCTATLHCRRKHARSHLYSDASVETSRKGQQETDRVELRRTRRIAADWWRAGSTDFAATSKDQTADRRRREPTPFQTSRSTRRLQPGSKSYLDRQ